MFKFRKIAAVLAGAIMLSSTVALAAATTYPVPFVSNGAANAAVVYGSASGTAASDIAAAGVISAELATALAAQTVTTTPTTTPVTISGGDSVMLSTSSSPLHVGEGVQDAYSLTIGSTKMPNLLADSSFTDSNGNTDDYSQKINVANMTLSQFSDSNYLDSTPTVGFNIPEGANILNYTLSFTDNPLWGQISGNSITMMGKDYYILDESNGTHPTLTLLDTANDIVLSNGQSQTVNVGNSTYNVSVSFISSSGGSGDNTGTVRLIVNGRQTNSLHPGNTQQLPDGAYLGVKSVLANDYAGGTSEVEFSIGQGKIILTDGQNVQVNSNNVDSLTSYITSGGSNDLHSITLAWDAPDVTFIATNGTSITQPVFNAVKLSFGGMYYPGMETTSLNMNGQAVQLQAPLAESGSGGSYSLNLLSADRTSGNFTIIGKDSNDVLRTTANQSWIYQQVHSGDSFVVSWVNGKSAYSYVLKTDNWGTSGAGSSLTNQTDIIDLSNGAKDIQTVKSNNGDTITLGDSGIALKVGEIDYNAKTINLTASGSGTTSFDTLYTASGLEVQLPTSVSGNTATLNFTEANKDGDIGKGEWFTIGFNTVNSPNYQPSVSVVSAQNGEEQQEIQSSNVFQTTLNSPLATTVTENEGPTQHTAQVVYHVGESYGQLFLTSQSAQIGGAGGATSLGIPSVSDSQITSVNSKNLIVVGGNCVNAVAAQLLNLQSSASCGADFESATGIVAGHALIKTYASPYATGQIATLVAGRLADDTTNAATYLTTQPNIDTTAGNAGLDVSSGTTATPIVKPASS